MQTSRRINLIFCSNSDDKGLKNKKKNENVLGKIYSEDDIEKIMFGIRCTTKKFHISLRLDFLFNIHSNTMNYVEQKQRSSQLIVRINVYKHVHCRIFFSISFSLCFNTHQKAMDDVRSTICSCDFDTLTYNV